ncbi:Asp23/Gls24 family envelope stress response protein [Prauserella alba]|uniref:Asp23/Gls24 family envelope stress response protein n=1 Tax=Prauserella alba TaxID=176898 RepID=A0ABN1V9F6_9PSEU|nr:Asp23/Gls24 family envelope stress response protein [Prauserella alba]MCP2181754.1 putative conserved protein YloU, alkaline shock protein (Asp23) family [Prauserella alba]
MTDTGKSTTQSPESRTTTQASGGEVEKSGNSALVTKDGTTTIADTVVQKIAALATREVSGVHDVGGGATRAFNAIRERIPGASASSGQGVTVEVGEKQAAIDLQILVEYGVSIADLSRSVRRNVITAVEQMTALEVVEVNIHVGDVHLPGDDNDEQADSSRVQ